MPFTWYLLYALLMTDGTTPATLATPYSTQVECEMQGNARVEKSMKDATIKDILWTCVSVDFSPAPQERPPPLDKDI